MRWVNGAVVGNVVAMVEAGGFVKWRDPDGVDAKPTDVLEFVLNADEVAYARAISIGKGANVDLITNGTDPPRVFVSILRDALGSDLGNGTHFVYLFFLKTRWKCKRLQTLANERQTRQ